MLYGKLRPYLDKAILTDDTGICTTELLVLRPRTGGMPRFVVGVVHALFRRACSGGHWRAASANIVEPHQRVRAAPVSTRGANRDREPTVGDSDALTANEAVIEEGTDLKRAAMRALFTRGLCGEAQKETEIGPVPESWDVVPMGSLGRIGNGSTPKKSVEEYWNGGTYPWLTSAKVYDREIESASQFVTETALKECHLPQLSPGAVLIAITGQGKTLGHCAVLRTPATINQHIAYLATDEERV